MFDKINQFLSFLLNALSYLGSFIVSDPLLSLAIAIPILLAVIRFFRNLRHK